MGDKSGTFDLFGRFREPATEHAFRETTWQQDRKSFELVAWMAAALIITTAVTDFVFLSWGSPELTLTLTVRAVCGVALISFALYVRRMKSYRPSGLLGFIEELIVIGSYVVIANTMPEIAHLQYGSYTILLVFIWFFVPIHPLYSLGSAALVCAGALHIQASFLPDTGVVALISLSLMISVIAMGIASERKKSILQRRDFLSKSELETTVHKLEAEVSERQKAEKQEAATRARYEGIFNASPLPLGLLSLESGNVISVNPACCELLGREAKDVVGRHFEEFGSMNGGLYEFERKRTGDLEILSGELEAKRPDGTSRECMTSVAQFDDPTTGEHLVLASIHDITERNEFERELIGAREKAESAQKTQSEFLATMSHEIRTPLNALLGFLEILSFDKMSEASEQNLRLARSSGEHLLRLITDILDLSRLSASAAEVEHVATDCQQLARDTIETFGLTARDKKLDLECTAHLSSTMYNLDPVRIRQILLNLVGNAVKFTSSGSVKLVMSDQIRSGWIQFEVHDTGIGVSDDDAERIFAEFTQADMGVTREYGGTGLGLAICKKLVTLMGGDIGVRTNEPAGSIFWFAIPAQPATEHLSEKPSDSPAISLSESATAQGNRLLIAEDNIVNQRVISAFVDSLGFEWDIANNGQDAVEALFEGTYAAVLMDIQMPVLDGLSAIRLIRSGGAPNSDVPIIAVTANAMAGDREAYLEAGANSYLSKPITLARLQDALESLGIAASGKNPLQESA